jgi:hypothetical protein
MMQRHGFLIAFLLAILVAVPLLAQKAQPTGTISGIVNKVDGTPQPGARVYLQPGDGHVPHTIQTDATGRYKFEKIRIGLYDVRAQAGGLWSDYQRNVNVRANQEVTVDLQIKPAEPPKPKNQ